jgi:hypothetical protein
VLQLVNRSTKGRTTEAYMAGKAKFKKVAKRCNKKHGKAARRACWRKAYRK